MTAIRYYHARGTTLEVNSELRYGWRRMMKSDPEDFIDKLLEDARKGRFFERNRSVFMIGLPSDQQVSNSHFQNIGVQSSAYIYELAPRTASAHDWYWLRELHARHPPLIGGKKRTLASFRPDGSLSEFTDQELADRYWRGEASSKARWEYLTDSAVVIACHPEAADRLN